MKLVILIWLILAVSVVLSIPIPRNRNFDWDAPVSGGNHNSFQPTLTDVVLWCIMLGTMFSAILGGITRNNGANQKIIAYNKEGKALAQDLEEHELKLDRQKQKAWEVANNLKQVQENLKDAVHDVTAKNADVDYTAFKNIQASLGKLNSDIYKYLGPPSFHNSPPLPAPPRTFLL